MITTLALCCQRLQDSVCSERAAWVWEHTAISMETVRRLLWQSFSDKKMTIWPVIFFLTHSKNRAHRVLVPFNTHVLKRHKNLHLSALNEALSSVWEAYLCWMLNTTLLCCHSHFSSLSSAHLLRMAWKQFPPAVQVSPPPEDAVGGADLTWLVVVVQFLWTTTTGADLTWLVVVVQFLPQWFILPLQEGQLERFIDGAWRKINIIMRSSAAAASYPQVLEYREYPQRSKAAWKNPLINIKHSMMSWLEG